MENERLQTRRQMYTAAKCTALQLNLLEILLPRSNLQILR